MNKIKAFCMLPQNIRIVRENVFAGVFVFLLLTLANPFDVDTVHEHRSMFFIAMGVLSAIVGIMVGMFTAYVLHMPLDPRLPLATVHRNSLVHYLINLPVLTAVLVSYAGDFFCDGPHRAWINDQGFTLVNFMQYLNYVAVTSVFLFIATYVRNRNWHLRYQLDEVRAVNAMLEQYQRAAEEKAEEQTDGEEEQTCRFQGATANAVLEVRPSDIIYVESMANYADVWYMEGDEARHKTLRITLKSIKESLDGIEGMVQCHRAFIVNLHFVIAMTNRPTGYQLQLFGTDRTIPVSRSRLKEIREQHPGQRQDANNNVSA
ncbi:MAG: LytTR family DNA-binding domain-containing protein [Prevotella sp.]